MSKSQSKSQSASATDVALAALTVATEVAPITTDATAQALVEAFAPLAPVEVEGVTAKAIFEALAPAPVVEAAPETLSDEEVVADLRAYMADYEMGLNSWTYVKLTDDTALFHRKGDTSTLSLPIAHAAQAVAELRSHVGMAVRWPSLSDTVYSGMREKFAKRGYTLPSRVRDGEVAIKGETVVKTAKGSKHVPAAPSAPTVPMLIDRLAAARSAVTALESMLAGVVETAHVNYGAKIDALMAAQGDVTALDAALKNPMSAVLKATFGAAHTAALLQVEALTGECETAEKNIAALTEAGLIAVPVEVKVEGEVTVVA